VAPEEAAPEETEATVDGGTSAADILDPLRAIENEDLRTTLEVPEDDL